VGPTHLVFAVVWVKQLFVLAKLCLWLSPLKIVSRCLWLIRSSGTKAVNWCASQRKSRYIFCGTVQRPWRSQRTNQTSWPKMELKNLSTWVLTTDLNVLS